jgi:hypothetical protein
MAQNQTYKISEIRWWGLPVGLSFIVAGFVGTNYANQSVASVTTGAVGAVSFLVLVAGLVALGAFVYSIITHEVGKTESKHYVPGAD